MRLRFLASGEFSHYIVCGVIYLCVLLLYECVLKVLWDDGFMSTSPIEGGCHDKMMEKAYRPDGMMIGSLHAR